VLNNVLNTGSNPSQPVSAHTHCQSDNTTRSHAETIITVIHQDLRPGTEKMRDINMRYKVEGVENM